MPDDDLDTIGLQWLLVAQSRMSTTTAGDLARAIYAQSRASLANTAALLAAVLIGAAIMVLHVMTVVQFRFIESRVNY